jgi:hypothetical protein
LDNVIFAATGAANQAATTLPGNLTINSLTVNSATGIEGAPFAQLTLTNGASINSALTLTNNITLLSSNALTIAAAGRLNVAALADFSTSGTVTVDGALDNAGQMGGSGIYTMAKDVNLLNSGSIQVEDVFPGAANLTLNTSGTGAVTMTVGSNLDLDLFVNAGNNTSNLTSGDRVSLNGRLDMTAGGEIKLDAGAPLGPLAGGDSWKLFNMGSGAQIIGTTVVNDLPLGLAHEQVGSFTNANGVYTVRDINIPDFNVSAGESITINQFKAVVVASGQTFTNQGTVAIRDSMLTIFTAGAGFINQGTVKVLAATAATVPTNPSLDNFGVFTNEAGATLTNNNLLNNYNSGAILTNAGTLTNSSTGYFNNDSGGTIVNAEGGVLTNNGVLISSKFINNGTVTNTAGATLINPGTIISASGSNFNNAGTLILDNISVISLGENVKLVNTGIITVGSFPYPMAITINTSVDGALIMGASSEICFDLSLNPVDSSVDPNAADRINLNGKIDATAGGTLRIGDNLGVPSTFAGNES